MAFLWKIPNDPVDITGLSRMKRHFHKPSDLMPVAWFIGEKIDYYTWLAEDAPDAIEGEQLKDAMKEIAGGITAFPEVHFVKTWQDWFKYLLPYAIANADYGSGSVYGSVLLATLTAFISMYPQQVFEEYDGFRNDVVYSLGTRIFPYVSSLGELGIDYASNLLSTFLEERQIITDDFSLPMLFGLKYLEPSEIEGWVKSIINLKNYAWRFVVLSWWLTFNKFLQMAENWPENRELEHLLGIEDSLVESFWITQMKYLSLDAFIPKAHLIAFQKILAQELTFEIFQSWVADISAHKTFTPDGYEIPLPEQALGEIQRVLVTFEQQFFQQKSSNTV
jgi:hypothetical protein